MMTETCGTFLNKKIQHYFNQYNTKKKLVKGLNKWNNIELCQHAVPPKGKWRLFLIVAIRRRINWSPQLFNLINGVTRDLSTKLKKQNMANIWLIVLPLKALLCRAVVPDLCTTKKLIKTKKIRTLVKKMKNPQNGQHKYQLMYFY